MEIIKWDTDENVAGSQKPHVELIYTGHPKPPV